MPGCAPALAQNSSSKFFGLSLNIPVQDRKYPFGESESKHVFNACQFSSNAQTLNSRFLAAPFGLDSTARRWVCERGMI
jgi:hypothetical protein